MLIARMTLGMVSLLLMLLSCYSCCCDATVVDNNNNIKRTNARRRVLVQQNQYQQQTKYRTLNEPKKETDILASIHTVVRSSDKIEQNDDDSTADPLHSAVRNGEIGVDTTPTTNNTNDVEVVPGPFYHILINSSNTDEYYAIVGNTENELKISPERIECILKEHYTGKHQYHQLLCENNNGTTHLLLNVHHDLINNILHYTDAYGVVHKAFLDNTPTASSGTTSSSNGNSNNTQVVATPVAASASISSTVVEGTGVVDSANTSTTTTTDETDEFVDMKHVPSQYPYVSVLCVIIGSVVSILGSYYIITRWCCVRRHPQQNGSMIQHYRKHNNMKSLRNFMNGTTSPGNNHHYEKDTDFSEVEFNDKSFYRKNLTKFYYDDDDYTNDNSSNNNKSYDDRTVASSDADTVHSMEEYELQEIDLTSSPTKKSSSSSNRQQQRYY
jgi:hypothetical protein